MNQNNHNLNIQKNKTIEKHDDIIKYYENNFRKDLESLLNSTNPPVDRISFVSITGNYEPPCFYGDVRNAFKRLKNKTYFLTCYFYCVLFGQAIHSYDSSLITYYDSKYNCPKFVGMLEGYWYNMHPGDILMAAILRRNIKNKEKFFNDFKIFTNYIVLDFINFLHLELPELGILTSQRKITMAANIIFCDIRCSFPRGRLNGPYSKAIDILRNRIDGFTNCSKYIKTINGH